MKSKMLAIAFSILPGLARAQEGAAPAKGDLTDGMEILKRADVAVKKVERVSYNATAKSTGWLAARGPASAEGKAVLGGKGKTQQDMGQFLVTVRTTPQGATEPVELTGGSDGNLFFLIDPAAKTVYEDIDPAVMGKNARLIQGLMMRAFTQAEPFVEELKAEKIEVKETQQVAGEECHQLHVTYAGGQGEVVWFLSKKDYLPRRRDRIVNNPTDGKATRELALSDLAVDPKPADNPFKAVVPEGFKKTDDFAP